MRPTQSSSETPPVTPPVTHFVFGDQGVQDHGWGCVYRCLQTCCTLGGLDVPSMEEIRKFFGVRERTWLEPIDCVRFAEARGLTARHIMTVHPRSRLRAFSRTEAPEVVLGRDEFMGQIARHVQQGPRHNAVIDNGTFSYAVLDAADASAADAGKAALEFLVGDPHCPRGPFDPHQPHKETSNPRWFRAADFVRDGATWAAALVGPM